MVLYWILFFFVAFIAKALLAFAMIYLLLPAERTCSDCDEETVLMQAGRLGRIGFALLGGRIQRRWCPHCGWEGLTRRTRGTPPATGSPKHAPSSTRH
jgi:hypothetical protein